VNLINNKKTIYGPVKSWRFGLSLGVDPIYETSICSFNCLYCQLGDIQQVTTERKIYVPTQKILQDFREILNEEEFDVITFSGSGEPTLASNLGEIAREFKKLRPHTPLLTLSNATLLHLPAVRQDLQYMDRVIAKLDAPNTQALQLMNRPAEGVSLESIIMGIKAFRKEFSGQLDIQMMFMPGNIDLADDFVGYLKDINPDTVQLNTPLRPYPLQWDRENRGKHHTDERDYETRQLRTISPEDAIRLEETLREKTGLNVLSVYRE